jgi:RimJ/RimL family protein N-acetyltransferase
MATFSPPGRPLGDGVVSLRPWTEADLPAIDAATRDPEIVRRNRLPQPFDAAAWFDESNVEQERGESLKLLIVDPTNDRFLGSLSLWTYDGDPGSAEIGLWRSDCLRASLAGWTASVRGRVLSFGFRDLGMVETLSLAVRRLFLLR